MTHEERLLFGDWPHSRRSALGFIQEYVSGGDIGLRFYQMGRAGEKSVLLDTLIRLSRALAIITDYLLFGNLSFALDNPLVETLNRLSLQQREDALKILQLFSRTCNS